MNVNSVSSMAKMAYRVSGLKDYDYSTGQFVINKLGNLINSNTSTNNNNNSSSDFEVTLSAKAKREALKQQELIKQRKNALQAIETSTTSLQDSAVAMSKNDYSNADETVQNLKDFIASYNNNLNTASKNSKVESTAQELQVDMQQTRYSSRFYGAIGVNVGQNGALSLDENKLRSALAADTDKVGNLIGGSSGLVAKSAAITDKYLGTTTVLNTYHAGAASQTGSLSGTTSSGAADNTTTGASQFETALTASLSSLYDSNTTLLNADLEASEDSAIVDAVKQYAADYSGTVNTLASYKKDYYSAEYLGIEFAEPRFKSQMYSSIGLNVASNGSMSVDADKLNDALVNNRDKVIELLQGDNGLLTKTDSLINSIFA